MAKYKWNPNPKKRTKKQEAQNEWIWRKLQIRGMKGNLFRVLNSLRLETNENSSYLSDLFAEMERVNDDIAEGKGVSIEGRRDRRNRI